MKTKEKILTALLCLFGVLIALPLLGIIIQFWLIVFEQFVWVLGW
jgi:hypothetical protein